MCQLERFDLSGNPALDQTTLIGYLACTMTNLKDATRIDAANKGLKGECALCVEPSIHALYGLLTFAPCFTGGVPKELGNLVNLTELNLSHNQFEGKLYVPAYMRCMVC